MTTQDPGAACAVESGDRYGVLPADRFVTVQAPASWPGVPRQALWYFRDETVALPVPGTAVASFVPGLDAFEDVRRWAAYVGDAPPLDSPPLVWIAAPDRLRRARIVDGGAAVIADGGRLALDLVARHPLNRSWLDASSFAYLAERPVSLRGTRAGNRFVARTIWPEDFALRDADLRAGWAGDDPRLGLRALMRERRDGGATGPFTCDTLWRRRGTEAFRPGMAVLGVIANGAQGDDDEAHAGHFAIVTGRVREDGAIGDWLVNNFYSLDIESEKGILAAPVPLDDYLADLNAGQAWYRPSYLLVAILDDDRAARLVQSALGRVYAQFYRHQLVYYHPRVNCTSISVDTLAALGWPIPARGASARWLARLALPWLLVRERGLSGGLRAADYLATDVTHLLPAVAFEEVGASLFRLAAGTEAGNGTLSRWLAEDLAAIALLRIPQIPSSRASGDAPVVSLAEYRARLPQRRRDYRIVPVPARPFPRALRDADLRRPWPTPAVAALLGWSIAIAIAAVTIGWLAWR